MKLAVHMSMFCKEWTDNIIPALEKVKKIGFDGVEISLYGASDEELFNSFNRAKELGLEIICGTGVGPDTDPSSSDENIRRQALEYLKKSIDKASKAGALYINGVLYAPWQGFSNEKREKRWENSTQVLREAGKYAKEKGIGLNVEVLNRFETDFMNKVEEGVEFIKKINLDNVKLLVDTFHMNIEENNICESVEKYIDYIGCIHVTENHRGVPGTGHIDWKNLIEVLKRKNYNGYLDMETFVESGTQVGKALFIWSGEKNPYEEAEKGFVFLKNLLGGTCNE